MLSPQLRRKVHDLWSLFWSSGLSNPLVAIEQITYLLFIRQLESLDRMRVQAGKPSIYGEFTVVEMGKIGANLDQKIVLPIDYNRCRWSYIRQNVSFSLLNETVFPWLRTLEQVLKALSQTEDETLNRISGRLSDAYFILDVNKEETLKKAVSLIDDLFRQLDTRSVNSDIMGDIFEYLLEEVKESGKNGQFRTPRHIIRFMVQLLNPPLGAKVLDPACGSGGFLLNSLLHWKADHTAKDVLRLEWDGTLSCPPPDPVISTFLRLSSAPHLSSAARSIPAKRSSSTTKHPAPIIFSATGAACARPSRITGSP